MNETVQLLCALWLAKKVAKKVGHKNRSYRNFPRGCSHVLSVSMCSGSCDVLPLGREIHHCPQHCGCLGKLLGTASALCGRGNAVAQD